MRIIYGVEFDFEIRDIEVKFLDLLGVIFFLVCLVVVDEFFCLFDGGCYVCFFFYYVFLYGL